MSRHACLNRAYRLVWDAMRNLWIPVAETARRRGKSGRVLTLSATLALAAGTGWALPTGGVITAGEGQIGQSGQVMTISQDSSRLAVDWEGFSIDRNETVNFVQPDTGAIALNRVLGQDPSRILGGLNANGQVFVLNPNGVLFGQQAQVSVGGLVASTLGLATPDFLSGNFRFGGTSTQEVSNAGALQARDGGYIALLGARVSNSGTLEAHAGSVNLAAGQAVTLQLADGSLAGLTVDQGSLDALAANHGLIRADGGQVLLTAEGADRLARAVVNHDGVIEARTLENRNGVIRLMGDMEVGAVQVDGTLDASAPTSGNGGFVETSAAAVRIGDDARITTLSATGVTGTWLIDPRDFLVSATGGDISGTSLSKELDLTSVVIQNTDGGVEGNGDIFINDLVAWSADTQLTLNAERNVQINDRIIADGKSAGLIIKPALGGEGRYSLGAGGSITLNGLNASLQISGTDFTLIRDINALQLLETKGGNYALATDIDASATAGWNRASGFTPIGTASNPFDGILDGLGHTLTGLTINRPTESGIGLFAQSNGQIRYVHLDKAAISGASTTAALVGINNGAVVGSSVNGQVQVTTNPDITGMADIGGLVGLNNGVISQSSSAAEVRVKGDAAASNLSYIGGLAGRNTNLIMDSVSTGAVTVGLTDGGTVAAVGGLVGLNTGSIDDSTLVNAAPVTGGAVQVTASAPALSNFSADIQHVGGVVGQNDLSLTLQTDKNAYRGGAVTVINDKPDGAISNVGGIVGTNNGILSDALATVSVTVTGSGVSAVGGGVGLISKGAVTNVHAAGTVAVQSAGTRFLQNIGGLVGENDADLRNSSAAGVVKVVMDAGNASNIGGLVGYNRGTAAGTSAMIAPATTGGTPAGAVYDSLASAAVEVTSSEGSTINAVAGQVGTNSGVINLGGIITPYNGGAVTVSMFNTLTRNAGYIFNVGGLLGQSQGDVLLLGGGQLFSAGPVTVSHLAQGGFLSGIGGIVGFNSSSKGLFSHVSGSVQATIDNATGAMAYSVGGVAGTNSGTISDGRGMVMLADSAGGMLDNATYVGGLVGSNYGVISDSQATGSVTGSNYVGGLVGQNYTAGTIQRSFFYGDVAPSVKVVGASGYVGGLVGQNDGTIQTSYFNGSVRGFDGLSDLMGGGGIAGFNSASGKISNSYAVGTVTGGNVVGGLVGANAGAIINSYAATTVTGSSAVGGLVGQDIDGSAVVGSFYDLGQTPDDGTGYGMATTDLMKGETFSLAGWDIAGAGGSSAIWRIYEGQTLPLLRNFLTGLTISANNAVKEYDGTGYAGGNGLGFSQTPSSDLLYGSAVFSGDSQGARNVGTYGLDVSGFYSSQQGYDISYQSGSLRIDPKTLLINAVALDRVYDGTIAAGVNANLVGVVAGEDVFLTATGVFDTRHAGQGKTVYASYVLGGMDDANYRITLSTDTLSASITPLDITGVITADSKVYDASRDAATHGTVSGVLGTDDVSLLTSGTFDDANAGKGKTVSLSYALSGNEAGNYSVTANGETTADIDPRMISGVIRVDDKVYDGTTDAVTSGTLSGVLDSDSLGMDTSGYFLDKQVGSSKTVTVSYSLTGSSAGNYVVTANTEALASITPRTLYGLVTADSKVYDATTDAITYGWLDGVLGTDDVGLVSSGYFLDKNVGTDKLVVLSHTVTGLDAKNYDVQVNTETLSEITPMEISAQVIADSKVYDATTDVVTQGYLSGVLGSDDVRLTTSGFFYDKHAGSSKAVSVSFMVDGYDAGNYTVVGNLAAMADITPREISGLIVADSKVYDATTTAVTSGSLSGVLGSDDILIDSTTGSFSDKHVGSSKTVTVGFTVAGADAGNYTVLANSATTANITPREISGLIVADSKVYDATTAAVTSGSLSGVLGSDELYIDATTGSFSDKHAGSSKTVTVGYTVAGADAGNYTVFANTATTANITPREISGLIVADSKVYDATTAAVTSGSLSGVLGSDELLIDSTTGLFSDKHVGSSKTVTVGYTVAGADAGNYTVLANTATTANITPREISGLIVADSKVYDATTAAVTSGSLSGVLGSDDLYIDATTGSFSDKHVGSSKTVTVGFTVAGADAGNYTVLANTATTANITPREISGLIVADSKVYDATTAAVTSGSLSGVLGSDDILIDSTTGLFSDKHVGSSKTVTVGFTVAGADAGNYTVLANTATTANITPREISGLIVADSKFYDATTAAVTSGSLSGVLGSDDLYIDATTGSFSDKHVGSSKTVTVGFTVAGADAGNYTVLANTATTANITPREISGLIVADSKVYDATTAAVTSGSLSGVLGSDDILIDSTTGVFSDKHVGTGKTVTVGFTVAGADAGNYTVLANSATTANITPREISGLIVADSKVYDATTAAVTSGSLSGVLGSDDILIDSTTGVFSDKHVGSSKTVTVGYTVAGADAGNYTVLANTATTASITPREISGLIVADSKVYDATTAAVTSGSLSGVLGSDDILIDSTTGVFSDKHVGTGKTVTVGFTVAGADAGNYTVLANSATTANITPREISGLIVADSKVYDATTAAVTSGSLSGVLGSDDILIDSTTGVFSDKHVGSSKTVTVGFTVAGADAGNYTVLANSATTANITPREISGLIVADSKVYDATTAAVTSGSLSGVLGSDDILIDSTTGVFSDKHVGSSKTVTVGFTVAGADAGNYTVLANSATTANITPREISGLIVADSKVYDATTAAVTSGSLSGVLGSDDILIDSTTGVFSDKHVGSSKTVTVGYTVAGADAGNYTVLANTATTANITPREISGLIVADSKVYDATTAAVTSGSLSGVLGSDELYIDATTGSFSDKHAGSSKTVTVGYTVAGADAGNYTVKANTEALADITPREISGLIVADSKVYDATTAAVTSGSLSGVLGSDDILIDSTTGSFSDKHVGSSKTVTVGFTVAGADAGNYTVLANSATTANITPREISGLIVADSKVYDATTAAVTSGSLSGVLGSDELYIDATTGSFSDKHVGGSKTVTVGYTVAGADAGNYTVKANTEALADITPREISGLIVADSKVYDATTAAVTSGSLSGVLGSDDILIDSTTGVFSDKHVGSSKTVTVGFTVAGADAGNYTVLANTATTASITPREISGLIVADSKVYDATTAAVTSGSLSGVLGSDEVYFDSTSGTFTDKNAGSSKTVTLNYSISGADIGNYQVSVNTTATADITKRFISGTLQAQDKVYDALTSVTVTGVLDGVLSGDVLNLSANGAFGDKNVGTDKSVSLSKIQVTGQGAANYNVTTNVSSTATITPLELTGTIGADDKVYDGSTAASTYGDVSGDGWLAGNTDGDDIGFLTTGHFLDKHVGASKTVVVSGSLVGADAGNYRLVSTNTVTTADITPLEISALIVADSKIYDATTQTLTRGDLSGVLGGDDVSLSSSGNFQGKDVGGSKTVMLSYSLVGADAGNYTVLANNDTTADITPREISGLIIADDKVYDGTTVATTSGSLIGVLGADDIRFDAISGSFSSKNAGSSKTVSLSYSLAGSDAGNYLVVANATTRATISKLAITGSLVAQDKIYDAHSGASVQRTLNGVLAGDTVTLSARGVFADKNVGTDKTVTFSQVRLLGTDAGNYTVSTNSSDTADIFIRDITASIFADSKVYDGTTTADTYADLDNLIYGEGGNPDDIYLTTTGQFNDRHAGDAKTVLVSGTLGGADMANYRLVSVNSETTADIYARDLSVVGSSVADKVYDGQLTAQVNVGALVGVLAGDQVAIDSASALFADRHVGNGKEVTATYNLTGASAGDYYAFDDTLLTGNITPKTLTISGSNATSKVYDGGVAAAVVAGQLQGVIAGDTVQVGAVGAFDSRHVGTGKAVATTYTLSGGEGGNYQLAGETLTADITPRTLTITGTTARDKVYDATVAAPVQTGVLSGKLAGDDVTAQAVGVFADKNVGSDKPVTVRYDLAGTDAGNYALSGQVLSADITPATLVIHANDATRAAGAADPGFSININNFLIGDNVSGLSGATFFNADASTSLGNYVSGLTGSLSFSTTATPASGPGLYAIVPGGLLAANYTIDFQPGVLTVTEAAQAGGEDGGIPFVNNPQDLPDPEDFENPVIVPPQDDDAPILGENGLLVVVGDGIQLPDGLSVDDDDDDENTF